MQGFGRGFFYLMQALEGRMQLSLIDAWLTARQVCSRAGGKPRQQGRCSSGGSMGCLGPIV